MPETAAIAATQETEFPPALWEEAGWLPVKLSVELSVNNFSVHDLLDLAVGSLVETDWKVGQDTPLRVNGWQVGWAEFEQIGDSLGVRLTELL
jgi:flagellar motor switch/type III secretory pathway protein FliN